jgi:sarcosine oxidase
VTHYDTIVIGTGGVGSAVLFHLARCGVHAVGIDRFELGHDRGSSHGSTRIIRKAYYEHPDYVPLVCRAYELWAELSERCGRQLYVRTGLLQTGPDDGEVIPGVVASASRHRLPIEWLAPAEIARRYPAFNVPPEWSAVLETDAGYLWVEDCVVAHGQEATKLGAELRLGEVVHRWRAAGSGVEVETDRETLAAKHLVVTAGPWASQLLANLRIPLRVVRKPIFWHDAAGSGFARHDHPAFLFETPLGVFYGFPPVDDRGVKVAEHTGGITVDDPLHVDRAVHDVETRAVEGFLERHLPGLARPHAHAAVCLYTLSPDHHFIVDRHPEYPQICFAAGLSGHGFKFTAVLGEVLADWCTEGETSHSVGFLSCRRSELNRITNR